MHGKFLKKMRKYFACGKPDENSSECLRRKLVIVGDGECGKTCLVTRMSSGTFVDNGYLPTVFETETVEVNTGDENVELVIFDTAGQEDYDRLRPFSYHGVDVALICFSLAEPDSLTNVRENWSPEIRHFCGDVPVILVGNKKDLRDTPVTQTRISSSQSSSSSSLAKSSPSSSSFQMSEIVTSTEDRQSSSSGNAETDGASSENDDVITKTENEISMESVASSSRSKFHVHAPVKHSEGAFTAKRIGAMAYFETSALTGEDVEELLLAATKAAVLGSKKSKKFKPFTETLKSWKSTSALGKR